MDGRATLNTGTAQMHQSRQEFNDLHHGVHIRSL
jgi:hypothetical protein